MAAPTVTRGMISTQTDTTNIKLDISEVIDFLSPFDVPFLDLIGRDSLHSPCTQIKHEWLEDQLTPRSGTLGAAYTAGDGQLTLTGVQYKYLLPGDTVLVDDIVFRVTAGAPDANPVLVTRIAGTDAAIANAATWRKVAHASQEGGVARNDGTKTTMVAPYNYTQILKDWIVVTGTMEVIARYGYANERAYNEEKTLRKLAIDLEYALLYGARYVDAGPPRISTMGGLFQFVYLDGKTNSSTTVVDNGGQEFTESILNDLLEDMWDKGGMPDFVVVNGTNKRRMTDWGTPRIRTDRGERMAGASIGMYESDFGVLDIILDRWIRPADVVIGTRGEMGIGPLTQRAFTSRLLPSTLDGTWYEILGEYTMEVHKPDVAWAWLYNTDITY